MEHWTEYRAEEIDSNDLSLYFTCSRRLWKALLKNRFVGYQKFYKGE